MIKRMSFELRVDWNVCWIYILTEEVGEKIF